MDAITFICHLKFSRQFPLILRNNIKNKKHWKATSYQWCEDVFVHFEMPEVSVENVIRNLAHFIRIE